ncbi:transcription cofactor vestigial-like protein 2b [Denticeps clupeoides]|uniref:Transcription cofactor vestigial-like protein 2 n=1 Tax=Denticeps clupeoides TaxID=299321 RepID=A0AAY4A132_9TELE|nr:transcription cofactor vestigial-like protein 2 [Denticeps clupeoides]
MSCLDVVYPAYGHYARYAPAPSAFSSTLPAAAGLSSPSPRPGTFMESTRTPRCLESVPGPGTGSPASLSSYPAAARPEDKAKDKQEVAEAEYLSSRCVLFTYYHGDISSVVDEHFSRALSTYMDGEGKKRPADLGADTPSPSSRRSFPPSFWDSNYTSPPSRPHSDPGVPTYSMDPYTPALHPGLTHPHPHHAETWGFSQGQPYGPPRPLHELYSPPGLEPHYGPLLMPAVQPAHLSALPGHFEVGKLEHAPAWPGLLPPGDVAQTLALNMDPGLQHHKKGKELYWF